MCDLPAYDTGRREQREGRTWQVAHCDGCGDDITFWEAPQPRRLDLRADGPVPVLRIDHDAGRVVVLFARDADGHAVVRSFDLADGAWVDADLGTVAADLECVADGRAVAAVGQWREADDGYRWLHIDRRLVIDTVSGQVIDADPAVVAAQSSGVRRPVALGTTVQAGEPGFGELADRVVRATGHRPVAQLATLTHGRYEIVDHLVRDERGVGERVVVWGEGATVLDLEIVGQRDHTSELVATGRTLARPWCDGDWLVIGVDRHHHVLLDLGDAETARTDA